MGFRFEYDPLNKILMARLEGDVTNSLVRELRIATHQRVLQQTPLVYIADCSGITKFSISSEFVRHVAKLDVLPGPVPRSFIVATSNVGYGLARMYQIVGEPKRSGVTVLRSLAEVFETLGIAPPQFAPLD